MSLGTRRTPHRAFTLQYNNITISTTIFLVENISVENKLTAMFSFNVNELTTFVDDAVCHIYKHHDLCIVFKTKHIVHLVINYVNKRNEVASTGIRWR